MPDEDAEEAEFCQASGLYIKQYLLLNQSYFVQFMLRKKCKHFGDAKPFLVTLSSQTFFIFALIELNIRTPNVIKYLVTPQKRKSCFCLICSQNRRNMKPTIGDNT